MRRAVVILFFLLSSGLAAQTPRFVNYSAADGLPSNTVYAISQDADGSLWVGTRGGLSRFDGVRFQTVMSGKRVTSLALDRENRLWVGTTEGLEILRFAQNDSKVAQNGRSDTRNDGPLSVIADSDRQSPLSGRYVRALCTDSQGALWAATKDSLLVRMHIEDDVVVRDTTFRYLIGDFEGDYPVQQLFPDTEGRIWLGGRMCPLQRVDDTAQPSAPALLGVWWNTGSYALNNGQLWAYDDYISSLLRFAPARQDFDNLGRLPVAHAALLSDSKGQLWAAGCYGLCLVNTESSLESIVYKHEADNPSSLASTELYCIFEDRQGNLWIGGNNGLSVLSPALQQVQTPDLPSKQITALMQASDGRLWVGTADDGAYALCHSEPPAKNLHIDYRPAGRPNEGHVSCLYEDRSGAVYIGLYAGCGFNIWEKGQVRRGFISGPIPKQQHVVADGDRITSNWITDFLEGGDGRFYVVSWEGVGLNEWDRKTGKTLPPEWLSPFKYPSSEKDSTIYLSSRLGSRLIEDAQGNLVYGTTEAGLNIIDKDTRLVTKYYKGNSDIPDDYVTDLCLAPNGTLWAATRTGLWSPSGGSYLQGKLVQSVISDAKGRLWAGTEEGLYFMDTDGSVGVARKALGFPSDIYNERAACKLNDGRLAFGGPEGAAVFHPDSLLALNASDNLLLAPLVQYRHRLNGGEWISGRFAGLPDNIRPGRYSLEEQNSDIFGRWKKGESTVRFIRVPFPLWLRWPFLLLYVLALSTAIWTFIRLRERRLLVKELDMRNQLFSIISHDLRNPVSGNRLLTHQLMDQVDKLSTDQLKEGLEALAASADNTTTLLENLLLWSLNQKGMLEPVMRDENLLSLAREAVESVGGLGIVTLDVPKNQTVRTDRNMLLTCLRNLLDNAVNVSPDSVILKSESKKIIILDQGPGLLSGDVQWSHGLGLVITRELLEKMGAGMEMKNRPEGGLEITITL